MRLAFSKMHGLGNDFVVIDAVRQQVVMTPELARQLADRHFGVGCDQVLLVEPPQSFDADFRYRIFNADGSEVAQCGNGARCFARFVHDEGLTDKTEIRVETRAGLIVPRLLADGQVCVDMGFPQFLPAQIPFIPEHAETTALLHELALGDEVTRFALVSLGNPHAVMSVEDVEEAPVARLGAWLERHPRFPDGVNVGFSQRLDRRTIRLRVFERGAGETLACGSGACAAAVCGIRQGELDTPVRVEMRGGALLIDYQPGRPVMMSGPAVKVFSATLEIP